MEQQRQQEEFKKQALQFILSIYLQRQNHEDIKFIQENVKSTVQFARSIGSNLKQGLNEDAIQKNKLMYGKNAKRRVKTFHLKDIIMRVVRIHKVLIFTICIIQIIFGTVLGNRQIYMDAVYALVLLICVSLIRIVTIYLNEKKKLDESYQKSKKQKYRVFRDGNFIQIPQTHIVVGDIIELDYKEKVPASGLLISNIQIAIDEEIYSKKVQRKMNIEKSVSYIQKLSLLELKVDAENQTLPSPIILRGTEQVYGSTYKILVIAVDEQNLLDKYKKPQDSTFVSNVIRDWFQKLQQKIEVIMRVISVIYLVLFLGMFGLKQFLQRKHLSVQMFFTDLFSVLLMSILGFSVFDTKCLRLFVETQVISYTQSLNNPKDIDKFLTVEQIYITQNNIVKYDEIIICQVGLPDKENTVKYEDLNILEKNTKNKIQEVLQGIGLRQKQIENSSSDLFRFKENSNPTNFGTKNNQIVHLNTVDEKIFSVLYNSVQRQSEGANNREVQKKRELRSREKQNSRTIFETGNSEQNASNISLNQVNPLDQDQPFRKQRKSRFRKKQSFQMRRSQGKKQETLKGYLGDFCQFKTQNIVSGIAQLAKQQSKTYYYQKYNLNRLKHIPLLFTNDVEVQMTRQRIQKVKRIVRNIRVVDNLTPFLIGYSNGAYNNNSMSVLVAVIGVKVNYENEIIQRLKELSTMGIRSTVIINKRDDEGKEPLVQQNVFLNSKFSEFHEEEDYDKAIFSEYISRGWVSHQIEQMIDFPTLKQAGGRIKCQCCFLSKCDCKNRVQQLSDIQSFLSQSQHTKIIHSLDSQTDIHYLQVASQQARNSVITIIKYKSDTIKTLQDIKTGYYLSNILEKGLNVWYGFMFVSATCFYPLALVSFGGVFCSGDISLWILFIQSLPAIGNMRIDVLSREKVQNQTRKNKVLYSKKSTLSVFLLCLISTLVATIFYIQPNLFIQESLFKIAKEIEENSNLIFDRDCKYQFSIFLSNQFNKIQCIPSQIDPTIFQLQTSDTFHIPQFIYSQNINFIFSYLCLNMLIFLMINFRNFTKPKVLLVYASLLGVYFFVIYVEADIIHGRYDGLTLGQLAIVFGMSILTNLVIQSIAYFSNYSCAVCDTEEFQSILAFEQNIEDHYSTKLKKYNNFQTEIYTLN